MRMTESVVGPWRRLAVHADGCDVCLPLVQRRAHADDPRRTDEEIHPHLCAEGAALHADLIAAELDYLAPTVELRRRLGVLGASQEAVELRDAAWARVPDAERQRVLMLGDHERFALLEALEAGMRRGHVLADLRAVARSEMDDRLLYRWRCCCGAKAAGDYFSGAAARGAWERHAGITPAAAPDRRECAWADCDRGPSGTRRSFAVRDDRPNQLYCTIACRDGDRAARRDAPRPAWEITHG